MKLGILPAAAAFALSFSGIAVKAEDARILVFGDSNAWGWVPVPELVPTTRYPVDVRWPSVMQTILGDGFVVINDSLSGRTAATSDENVGLGGAGPNGLEYLPAALGSHMPLDLVVIALGTNDVKDPYGLSAEDISDDIMSLVAEVERSTGVFTSYPPAKVLVVAPPPLGAIPDVDWLQATFSETSIETSIELGGVLCDLAESKATPCFDAASVVTIDGIDGLHMSASNHRLLGEAVAAKVLEVLQ